MTENLIGSATALFPVRLSTASTDTVEVQWQTQDGSAIGGIDYKPAKGVAIFSPGETEKQIEVIVYGQTVTPAEEKAFFIRLAPPKNAVLVDSLLTCLIHIDDSGAGPVLEVIVPQGKRGFKGEPGMSSYDLAVQMGLFDGTIEEWMAQEANAGKSALRAEQAAVAANIGGKVYSTPSAGINPLTGVKNGEYFNVRSPNSAYYVDEYINSNGTAVSTGKSYPSAKGLEDAQNASEYSAAIAEAAAVSATIGSGIYQTPEAGVNPVGGVPSGSYYNVRSSVSEHYVDEYRNVAGSPVATGKSYLSVLGVQQQEKAASTIRDASGKNQQQINNGFNTIADMLAIESPFDGMRVYVKSYRAPNLALNKPHLGGGEFVYVSSLSSLNDGVSVFNGFVRLDRNIDPYCAGAYGDGVTDDTQYIQRYFNYVATRSNKDAPLFGEFIVDQVLLKSQHNDLIVRDGKLKKVANPAQTNLALIEVGHKSNTDDDISGMLFKNLVLEASAQYTGDYNVDDPVNTASKQFCVGIRVLANKLGRVRNVTFDNIHCVGLGSSGVTTDGVDYAVFKNISGFRVNKHIIGCSVNYMGAISTWPADFNPVVEIQGVNATESGTIFDLSTVGSSKDDFGEKCATALISNANGTDLTLRTKIHGYWDVQISNFVNIRKQFSGQPIAPYAGIDVVNLRIKRLKINNMTVEGAVAGITCDNSLEGDIQINNLTVKNSLRGIVARCVGKVTVNGFNTDNVHEPYIAGNDVSIEINGFCFKKSRTKYWQDQVSSYTGTTLFPYPIQGTVLNHSLLNGSFEDFGEDDVANIPPAYIAYLTVKGTNNISNVKFLNAAPIKQGNGLYFETATGATTYLSDITEKDKFVNTNIIRSQGTSAVDGTVNQMLTLTKNLNLISNVNEKFACTLSNNGNFWIWLGSDNKPRFSLTRPLLRADGQVLGATI